MNSLLQFQKNGLNVNSDSFYWKEQNKAKNTSYGGQCHKAPSTNPSLCYPTDRAKQMSTGKLIKFKKTTALKEKYGTINSRSGRYEILEFIGEGSFGMVVKCLKKNLNKTVALKIAKEEVLETYSTECDVLYRLREEEPDKFHLLHMLDFFRYKDLLIIVTEILDKSLRAHLVETQFKPFLSKEVKLISEQMLVALIKLKDLKIIHGDIKPGNILFVNHTERPFQIKLVDFGMAVQLPEADVPEYIQTVCYRSPEIILQLPFSEAIDIWSVGCVLAELLLGSRLFPSREVYNVMRFICEMQGLPPEDMLNNNSAAEQFFVQETNTNGFHSVWRMKSTEQYERETGCTFQDTRRYKFRSVREIAKVALSNSEGDHEYAEEVFGITACVDLIKWMLQLDDRKRISPRKALEHRFIRCSIGS